MLAVQHQLFCDARSALDDIVTGLWWKEYVTLMRDRKVVSSPFEFDLGHIEGRVVKLFIFERDDGRVFPYVALGQDGGGIDSAQTLRRLYGESGQPLYPHPHGMLVRIYLKIESRIFRERQRAESDGVCFRVREIISFENKYFPLFNKQLAFLQSNKRWVPRSCVMRKMLSWRIKSW